jgi:hypothetical protein
MLALVLKNLFKEEPGGRPKDIMKVHPNWDALSSFSEVAL